MLGLVFHDADEAGRSACGPARCAEAPEQRRGNSELKTIGGLNAATASAIVPTLLTFSDQGADVFFGDPEFDTLTCSGDSRRTLAEAPPGGDRSVETSERRPLRTA